MDRSNFYFRQLTTEQNLDNAFDDVERMEQERTMDADTWGVWHGLVVTEQAVPDLTVKVSAGVAHDELGRRIKCPSDQNVDLSGYLPVTPGNTRKIHIYVENADIATDSRIDGNGNPLYYRKAESYQIAVVAGTEANPGLSPAIVADQVLLAEITLTQGQTTILNADIAGNGDYDWMSDQRQPGGIPWRRGRAVADSLLFESDHVITGPESLTLKGGAPGTAGIDFGKKDAEDVGQIVMTALAGGGLGINMNDRPIWDALSVGLLAGGQPGTDTGVDCNDRDIVNVGKLIMTVIGSNGKGIDMQDTDISSLETLKFKASAAGIGGSTDPLPVTVSLDLVANDIVKATKVQAKDPAPASGEGFLYANPTTGALKDVAKYWACDASHMFPGGQQDQHAHDSNNLNGWYIDDVAIAGLNVAGDAGWRMNFTAPDGENKPALYVPLVGIPNGAKLISANVSYSTLGIPHADHYLRLYLLRRNHGNAATVIDKLGNDPPNNQRQAAMSNHSWTESFITNQIIDLLPYAYFLAIVHHASGGLVPQEDVYKIRSAFVAYQIREASGVY